ncbi:MAG: hypothetical protein AB1798_17890 [Spirochaetota bacterium]
MSLINYVSMSAKSRKPYLLIPVFYACVIIFLLFLHFSNLQTFTEKMSGVTITGLVPENKQDRTSGVESLSVALDGINFPFNRKTPVLLFTNNGTSIKAEIKGYTLFKDGIELRFTKDVVVKILTDSRKNKTSLLPVIANRDINIRSISFPFLFRDGIHIGDAGRLPIISLSDGENTYFLSLPQGSFIDMNNKRLNLSSDGNNEFSTIVYEQVTSKQADPFSYWFSNQSTTQYDREMFEKTVKNYIDNAYDGWRVNRYDADSGAWKTGGEKSAFRENIVVALMAEGILRGEYGYVYSQVRKAASEHIGDLTFFSSPYLGRILTFTERQMEEDLKTLRRIKELLVANDPKVFLIPNLLQFIVDRGPYSLLEEVYKLVETVDYKNLDIADALGILRTYTEAFTLGGEVVENLSKLYRVLEEKILPAIVDTEAGLFLQYADGTVNLADSLLAGKLLILAGEKKNQKELISVGNRLIISALSLSDAAGMLPETLFIKNNNIDKKQGILPPEVIYPLITESPYYPKAVSLYRSLTPGSWIWTCASIKSISANPKEIRLSLQFPKDGIHHLIIQEIKPFKNLSLFGIDWRPDPEFQSYTSGWLYRENTQTLFMKIKHKMEIEEIIISY